MREDLLGAVKQELRAEFKVASHRRRRILPDPRIVNFGLKPEPHVIVRVSIPRRIEQRIRSMKNPAAAEFFEKGPGKRILQKGTLVILVHEDLVEEKAGPKPRIQDIRISAVGTIVERKDPMRIVKIPDTNPVKRQRVLEVGVSFTPESMRTITPFLQQLESRDVGVRMVGNGGGLFNASSGIFLLEPILKAFLNMDLVPMSDQLVHLKTPKVPAVAHGGKNFSCLSSAIQKAVSSDESQQQALGEIFKSNVVLVQGPPGTGKTYIGVQMVKTMLEFEKNAPSTGHPLRILCLCYTNHALDSFLLDLIQAGVPEERFIRLGGSPKIDPKIKSRCLSEVKNSVNGSFNKQDSSTYRYLKTEYEILEMRSKELLQTTVEDSKWRKTESWWRKICEFLSENYYEEYDQFEIPPIKDTDGFHLTGKNGKQFKSNYLWERWVNGKGRGIFQDETLNHLVCGN